MLASAILSEVVATLSLGASEGFSRVGPTALMAVGYLVSFVFLAEALKRGMGIGVAHAVWASVGVALVAGLGRVLFDEPLSRLPRRASRSSSAAW
jgi:small multidrug resistance pump